MKIERFEDLPCEIAAQISQYKGKRGCILRLSTSGVGFISQGKSGKTPGSYVNMYIRQQ